MDSDLKSLKIDRGKRARRSDSWATRWILTGIAIILLLGAELTQAYANQTSAGTHPKQNQPMDKVADPKEAPAGNSLS